jgi:hypothetical protein
MSAIFTLVILVAAIAALINLYRGRRKSSVVPTNPADIRSRDVELPVSLDVARERVRSALAGVGKLGPIGADGHLEAVTRLTWITVRVDLEPNETGTRARVSAWTLPGQIDAFKSRSKAIEKVVAKLGSGVPAAV